jgi:sugar/nucleoside kinase (ribokinase family)
MHRGSTIFVGFDGFVDSLFHCVAKRISPKKFTPLDKIGEFAAIAKAAASKNASVECVLHLQDLGGNGPLLARALASLSHNVILAGCCGHPKLHPIFLPLPKKNLILHSIANPGLTDALEFSDGKLFLGKMGELSELSLFTLLDRFPSLDASIQQSCCIATVNWTMMRLVDEFWSYLLKNRHLLKATPTLFVDLANPAKRTCSDLQKCLSLLAKLNKITPVILGLNRAESELVAKNVGLDLPKSIPSFAQALRQKLRLSSVLIHTKKQAVVASEVEVASQLVPVTDTPFRTTGAGDTFNAGFLSALMHGKNMREALRSAVAASGVFIRTGTPPTPKTMKEFFAQWEKGLFT